MSVKNFNIYSEVGSPWWVPGKVEKTQAGINKPEPYTLIPKHFYQVKHTGRGCQKSTLHGMTAWRLMKTFKNVDILVVSDQFNTMKESVVTNLHNAAQILKLNNKNYFIHATVNNIKIEYYHFLKNGKKITNHFVFKNAESQDLKRGLEPTPGCRWIMIWLYEFGKMNWNLNDLNIMISTIARSMLYIDKMSAIPCDKDDKDGVNMCRTYIEFNTPPPGSKFAGKLLDCYDYWRVAPDVMYQKCDYEMFEKWELEKFLGLEQLKICEFLRKYATKLWENEWKGLEGYSGDQIFYNVDDGMHLGKHDFEKVKWVACTVGIDCGRHAGTSITASLLGYDVETEKPVLQLGYKHWFHCNYKAIHREWNWKTSSLDEAIKNFKKRDVMNEYVNWIKRFLLEIRNEVLEFGITRIEMRMDWQNEGSAWWDRLFETWPQPEWLLAVRVWDKTELDAIFIDSMTIQLSMPGFLKTHVPDLLDVLKSGRYDKNHETMDRLEDLSLKNDRWDSIKYTQNQSQYHRIIEMITHEGYFWR